MDDGAGDFDFLAVVVQVEDSGYHFEVGCTGDDAMAGGDDPVLVQDGTAADVAVEAELVVLQRDLVRELVLGGIVAVDDALLERDLPRLFGCWDRNQMLAVWLMQKRKQFTYPKKWLRERSKLGERFSFSWLLEHLPKSSLSSPFIPFLLNKLICCWRIMIAQIKVF